jgi:AraC-like DNA-binding protein
MAFPQNLAISIPPIHPSLQTYIKSYHLIEMNPSVQASQMVPASSKCILGIPYGEPVHIHLKGRSQKVSKPFFLGMARQSYHYATTAMCHYRIFCIEFNDVGFFALFRENTESFVDTLVSLDDVVASCKLNSLQSLMADALSVSKKIAYVEQFLLQFLPDKRTRFRLQRYDEALSLIRSSKGLLNVKALASEFCLSERQFRRIITEIKGCSPKDFARLIRFTHIFSDVMLHQGSISWAELAYQYQFYDQMHFIKEFRHFSQFNPSQFPRDHFLLSSSLSLPSLQTNRTAPAAEKEEMTDIDMAY